jgi:hypothetical protein
VPEPLPASEQAANFAAEVERVRNSGQLGRGTQMQRLFEFLVACQTQGRVPKELEIAVDGFGRGADFDVAQDATVRVTAHKLRRRLEDFYREVGANAVYRLALPRGEYRLTLASVADSGAASAADELPARRRWRDRGGWIASALLGVICIALAMALWIRPDVDARVAQVREAPLWAALMDDQLPIQLVLGDYYIFGETNGRGAVQRLIRDFEVNSQQDLEQRFVADPQLVNRYADLKLGYLPTSSAQALREVLPVVTATGKHVTLTLASELDPSTVKTTHVIYIGYLSALGMLEDMVFGGSRYAFGGSYDELLDGETGRMWTSNAGEPHSGTERYTDYAYVAAVPGPGNIQHLIIAGTRDIGLMQAAENLASISVLQELARGKAGWRNFEALYEVQGVNGVNVESRLIGVNPTRATQPAP